MPLSNVYQVWHAQSHLFQEDAGDHRHVANVTFHLAGTHQYEIAFTLTNHISHDWRENDNVEALVPRPRSTSVGDVIIGPDGIPHRVCAMGFRAEPDLLLGPATEPPDPMKGDNP